MPGTMKNTFTSTQMEFVNVGLHFFFSEVVTVRQQIMASAEVNKLAGWSDGTNEWIKQYLRILTGDLDRMLAANNTGVAMSAFSAHLNVAHDLSGEDKNMPQPTQDQIRNVGLRAICHLLDRLAVQVTHFDSRWMVSGINSTEHKQAETFLTHSFEICELHGGTANNRELITGVLPRDLDDGFNYSGQYDTNFGTLDVGDLKTAESFRVNESAGRNPTQGATAVAATATNQGRSPGR